MTVRKPMAVAVALLCGCILALAGCGSADTAVTTFTAITTETADGSEAAVATETTVATEIVRLYRVYVDGKWGFIDNTGTVEIEPAFEAAYCDFSEGLAPVDPAEDGSLRFGYIGGLCRSERS